jgi:hypothetical protein
MLQIGRILQGGSASTPLVFDTSNIRELHWVSTYQKRVPFAVWAWQKLLEVLCGSATIENKYDHDFYKI